MTIDRIVAHAAVLLYAFCGATPARGAESESSDEPSAGAVEIEYARNLELYAGRDDVMVRPGLVANRTLQRVVVRAEATGLTAGETAEFFLIAPGSSHGYEALAMSHARASDIHAALEFIGVPRGIPADMDALRFWPKGERVFLDFLVEDGVGGGATLRAERMIWDQRQNRSMKESGFVFIGSAMVDDYNTPGERVYAADAMDPRSIASNYNEPRTVLDVPRQAPQGEVYETQSVRADHVMARGTPLRVTITPEYTDGKRRVVDIELKARPAAGGKAVAIEDLSFDLRWDGQTASNAPLNRALSLFADLVADGHDPHVTLDFDDALTLQALHDLCRLLSSIETETGIRVEPPPAGRLYYRAHIPNEAFRERSARHAQPWELHLRAGEDGAIEAAAVRIEQVWRDDSLRPDLRIEDVPAPTPDAFREAVEARPGLPALLVFADPSIRHADLLSFVTPVREACPAVHVYLGRPTP